MVEIWDSFTFSVFLKKFTYIIRFNIYFFVGGTLSLINMQRTTPINFSNSCTNHLCFCFIKCYLKYFLAVPFRIYAPLSSARHETIGISFFMQCTKKVFSYANRFANTMKLHIMKHHFVAASYISPVSVLFVLFLYVSCFGYLFASLLCGGNLHSSSLVDMRSTSKAKR